MSAEFSLYLDVVRVTAAFFVLWSHTNTKGLSEGIPPGTQFGHTAVIVFFVLSGYVIAYVTDSRRLSAKDYAVGRIARIYSVALPALILTLLLDLAGEAVNAQVYEGQTTHDFWWLRLITTTTLMNEFWGLSIQAFSNGPFWSIAYEGWYYILFGLYTFTRGPYRNVILVVGLLLCGPKIILLLPVWLMGVHLHRVQVWRRMSPRAGLVLFVTSVALFVGFHEASVDSRLRGVVADVVGAQFQFERMTFSAGFLGDYVLGSIVLLNFASFRAAAPAIGRALMFCAAPIRWISGYTLSLYLFHKPLMLFFIAILAGPPGDQGFLFEVVVLVIVAALALGLFTERRKDLCRDATVRLFDKGEALLRQSGLSQWLGSVLREEGGGYRVS